MAYPRCYVQVGARRALAHIFRAGGGRLPPDFAALRRLAMHHYDLDVQGVRRPGFTAELVQDFAPGEGCNPYAGEWTIYYNSCAAERLKFRYLVHELAEYIAICDYPTLFDGILGCETYRYDGGANPEDVRHLIARRVEELCFRRV